jgi:uncharacterized protein
MSRLLWWLLLGLGAWWLMRRLRGGSAGAPPAQQPPTARPQPAQTIMVRCVHCGLHLPQADALTDDAQRSYCSAAHRSAGPA